MNPLDAEAEVEVRRERAICQLDVVIDVLSAWRGRYEDDDRPATTGWIKAVIPEMEATAEYRRGWLCVRGTADPGIGWQFRYDTGQFSVCSLCQSMRGVPFVELTRGQFRQAARDSGVCLPARHATLYLDPAFA